MVFTDFVSVDEVRFVLHRNCASAQLLAIFAAIAAGKTRLNEIKQASGLMAQPPIWILCRCFTWSSAWFRDGNPAPEKPPGILSLKDSIYASVSLCLNRKPLA